MIGTKEARRRGGTLLTAIAVLGVVTAMTACGDNDDDLVNPVGAVRVFADSGFNFATLHTFVMPDTVAHFAPLTGVPLDVTREFDQTILQQVRADFLARGYIQETNPVQNRPDFVVLVGASASQNYNAWVSYSWFPYYGYFSGWGWYTPGFDSGWSLGYPWYATVGVTAYDRGTIVVTIVPTNTVQINPLTKNINAAWAGVATGLLNQNSDSDDHPLTQDVIQAAINQMFVLSPYLVNTPQ
jgi:hypothetical protein